MYSASGDISPRTINVYDAGGKIVYRKIFPVNGSYESMVVDLRNVQAGTYAVEVRNNNGAHLATGRVKIR